MDEHCERARADDVRATLARGERLILRARGQSMRPTLRDGAHVHVAPLAKGAHIAVGDILLVQLGPTDVGLGGLALHRVIDAPDGDGRLRTRGDGRRTPDPPIHLDAVLGRAEAVWLWGRRVDLMAPPARFAARLWAACLPYLWPLRRRARE